MFAVGALFGAAFLGLVDVIHAWLRMPEPPPLPVAAGAWVASTGALAGVAIPLLLAHREALSRVPRKFWVAVGALDGLVLGSLGLLVEDMPSIANAVLVGMTLAVTAAGAAAGFLSARWPRLVRMLLLVGGAVLVLGVETMPRGRPWLRFATDIVALGACGAVWENFRSKGVSARAVASFIGLGAFAALLGVRLVPALRGIVYEYGTHARALLTWTAALRLGPEPLGDKDCEGARRRVAPALPRSALSGAAGRADVLLLTFDAMRWDYADTIPEVWREVGPHVRFSRAVSPSARTEFAFAALLRGVPARRARSKKACLAQPTIAQILVRHGYRAAQVPTHFFFGAREWMNTGFELVFTPEYSRERKRIVPADAALKKALAIARETEKPLALWVHLMEGHEPYRWQGGQGPQSPEGQRHAFRDLDRRAAAFIREFKASRPGRGVIIAIFADHGEEFGEHGGYFHSTRAYAEQIRVPFALGGPGLVPREVDAPVSIGSLPATLVELLGMEAVETFVEPSLVGCIAEKAHCPELAVSETPLGNWIGYTFPRYRLVASPEFDIERLYDSSTDPLEKRDLAPSEPALLARLRERAESFDRANCLPVEHP